MSDKPKIAYGPANPHPLSQMRTELVWEGKYDEFGNRREVEVASYSMPLQLIETIDEPRSRMQAQGSFFDTEKAHRDDFRNKLIWGDNKLALASLLREFQGAIDLIYIDPPFDVGADFSAKVPIGDKKDTIEKEPSILEMVAYRDTWGRGTGSFASMVYERVAIMKDLLTEDGSICVHCDWHASHIIRAILNDVFGSSNFQNEIVWWYYNKMQGNVGRFASNHDVIFWYSKSKKKKFSAIREQREETKKQQKRVWDPETKSLKQARDEEGNLIYYDEDERTIDDVWRIPYLMPADKTENVGYETQKPVELVGRIIDALCPDDGIVLDAFCGSGTTLVAAEGLRANRDVAGKKSFSFAPSRKWIGCDIGRFSIHTTRKRLINIQRQLFEAKRPYRSFDVFNLGRYERQWWQQEALKGAEDEHRNIVLNFFRAEPLPNAPSPLIHGRKATAFIHVDGIDSIFSREEAKAVAQAVKAAGGKQVHCLAWDFEMDIRQAIAGIETELDVKIRLHRIPREIMEKNRTEVPPFFEVALLEAEPVIRKGPKGNTVEIKLKNFLPSLTEVPSKELEALQERAMTSGFDFIDFWAIDFDWVPGKPFNHHWQDYRTRKDRSLKTVSDAEYAYDNPGKYTACIKVVDVFGCDTSITVEIEV